MAPRKLICGSAATYVLIFRACVYYYYSLEGLFNSAVASVNPRLKDELNVNDVSFGAVILFFNVGYIAASWVSTFIIALFGSKRAAFLGAQLMAMALVLVGLSGNFAVYLMTMTVFGLFQGVMDISMNSMAFLTEVVTGKKLLGSNHAVYSVSAAVGGQIVAVFLGQTSLSDVHIYTCYAMFGLCATLLANFFNIYSYKKEAELLKEHSHSSAGESRYHSLDAHKSDSEERVSEAGGGDVANSHAAGLTGEGSVEDPAAAEPVHADVSAGSLLSVEARPLLLFALVAMLACFGEGSISAWATIFYMRSLGAPDMLITLGYSFFMAFMAVGRFSCDYLRLKFGRVRIIRWAGVTVAAGSALIYGSTFVTKEGRLDVVVATLAFSMVGLGLSCLIPTMYSSAGHLKGVFSSATNIAVISAFTNFGCLISGPVVGGISQSTNVGVAMLSNGIIVSSVFLISFYIQTERNQWDSTAAIEEVEAQTGALTLVRTESVDSRRLRYSRTSAAQLTSPLLSTPPAD